MALTVWRLVGRTTQVVVLATDGATLVIEASRLAGGDPLLAEVIARFAPHLAFGAPSQRSGIVERIAMSGDERVAIGRFTRGATSIAYMLSSREPLEIDAVLGQHLLEVPSPFEYLAD